MDLHVRLESIDDWTVVAVSGEVDVATAPALRSQLVEIAAGGAANLILDLDGVDFIDSTGLGVVVGALKRARSAGGDLRVACSSTRVLRVFELTRLDRALVIGDTLAATIAATEV